MHRVCLAYVMEAGTETFSYCITDQFVASFQFKYAGVYILVRKLRKADHMVRDDLQILQVGESLFDGDRWSRIPNRAEKVVVSVTHKKKRGATIHGRRPEPIPRIHK